MVSTTQTVRFLAPGPDLSGVVPRGAACTLEHDLREWHLLVWVWSGTAEVEAGRRTRTVDAGQAMWIPAGTPVRAVVPPGSGCIPLAVPRHEAVVGARDAYVVDVPEGWRPWLLAQFSMRISPLRPVDPLDQDLTGLLAANARDGRGAPDVVLPMPRTQLRQPDDPALLAMALALGDNVAEATTVGEWARRTGFSERSLQRAFRDQTALTFREWRAVLRLHRAAAHLAAGLPVGVAAHRVGYSSTSGFSRAFRTEFGVMPSAYAACVPTEGAGRSPGTAPGSRAGGPLVDLRTDATASPPVLGASATPPLVNNFHVVIWMAHGGARVEVGDAVLRLEEGDAVWLPAWRHNRVEVDAGGVMLPLFHAPPPTLLDPDSVVAFSLAGEDREALLRAVVGQYTRLRPDGWDERSGWWAFERWRAASTARDGHPGPSDPSDPSDPSGRGLLDAAPRLLAAGMSAGHVAARLGYRHPSSFTRAFRRVHGKPPRDYVARRRPGATPGG